MSTTYRFPEDIRFRVIGDEAVVLRLGAGRVLGLNPIGTRILELVEQGRSDAEVIDTLIVETGEAREILEQDVATFLAELVENGILSRNT